MFCRTVSTYFSFLSREGHIVKINGTDVREYTDEALSKLQGVIKTTILLGFLFMIAVALWIVGSIAKTILLNGFAYYAEHFFEWFFIPLLMRLVIFLFPGFIVAYLIRQKKGSKQGACRLPVSFS